MTDQEQAQLLDLIGKGKIADAIEGLLSMDLNDSSKKQALSISHRFKKLEQQKRSNIITFEQANVAESQIVNDLMSLINHANDELTAEVKSDDKNKSSKSTIWKYITAAAVIMGILGGLAEVIGLFPDRKPPVETTLQLTVFVTDINGNVVLENEGELNTFLGNRSLNKIIGEDGRTNFGDITPDNKGDTITIGLQAEGWEIVGDNTFVFTGKRIVLKVKENKIPDVKTKKVYPKNKNEQKSNMKVISDKQKANKVRSQKDITRDSLEKITFLRQKLINLKAEYEMGEIEAMSYIKQKSATETEILKLQNR